MGIKGTVKRSTDGDFIHANVDIDLIITEEPEIGNIEKPVEIFHIIEHFCLGRRRLHLFGRDSTIRPGRAGPRGAGRAGAPGTRRSGGARSAGGARALGAGASPSPSPGEVRGCRRGSAGGLHRQLPSLPRPHRSRPDLFSGSSLRPAQAVKGPGFAAGPGGAAPSAPEFLGRSWAAGGGAGVGSRA